MKSSLHNSLMTLWTGSGVMMVVVDAGAQGTPPRFARINLGHVLTRAPTTLEAILPVNTNQGGNLWKG